MNREKGQLKRAAGIRDRLVYVICACLSLSLLAVRLDSAEESAGSLIREAREAAAADRHEESIELFLRACNLDSSLAPEMGKEIGLQYMWNDRSREALPWFEAYLKRYPEDMEGLLGYARALSWSDLHGESLDMYGIVKRKYPGSVDASLGEARVISWMDKNGEAEALYRKILSTDPDNMEATLGLAQVINWQGRHREARRRYREILRDDPGRREALIGLAAAERWLGMNDRARDILEGLGGEAERILAEINREVSPFIMLDYGISSDSDHLVIHSFDGIGTYFMGDRMSAGLSGRRLSMRQNDRPKVTVESLSLRFYRRFDEDWSLHLNLTPLKSSIDRSGPAADSSDDHDFNPFTFDGWLTWTPFWRVRMDISSYRAIVETPLSVEREITIDGIGDGLDLRLVEGAAFRARYDYRSYSDGNDRHMWSADLAWRILRKPLDIRVVPGYTGFSFSGQKQNGYYNPAGYHNIGCMLSIGGRALGSISFLVEGKVSREKEKDQDFFTVGTFRSTVEWRMSELVKAGGEFFTSNSRIAGEAGYSRTLGRIYLVAMF